MGRQSQIPQIEAKLGKPIPQFIIERVKEGKKLSEIAQELEIGLSQLYEWIKKFGLREKLKEMAKQAVYSQGASILKEDIDNYLQAKINAEHSLKTVTNYKDSLYGFLWWLKETNKVATMACWNAETLNEFFTYLKVTPVRWGGKTSSSRKLLKPSTRRAYYIIFRAFENWLFRQELIEKCIFGKMGKIEPPKVKEREPEDLPDEILTRILNSFVDNFTGVRNRTIILMFLDTGMRLDGVVNLEVDQFDLQTGWAKIVEKGNKERNIHLSGIMLEQLRKYVALREPLAKTTKLWINVQGGHFGRGPIKLMVAVLNQFSDDEHRVHPHIFRHCWAKALADAEVNPLSAQIMGGWEDIKLYMHYSKAFKAKKAWADHDKASPVTRLLGEKEG